MKFIEAKEIKDENCAFVSNSNSSAIWWIDKRDCNSHLKYSAARYDGINIPKYRTRFTEYSMIANGREDVEYRKIIPKFNLNEIPLYE